ncbi:hypothetical protein AVEN_70816-1 [Araneus ventricosus]|uniref:RNA-directed DNA polymerase n=1 Tax=Araneus ventricosus TaxID=182803 RepID=A0A4Y2XAK5_ARAVE|nr:hypothetical protein AVEN_70816-1 [Araneus ventricosus]
MNALQMCPRKIICEISLPHSKLSMEYPTSRKVSAITDFPEPSTVKELRRFLALINFYRRFVPNAARTQAVLNAYLKGAKKNDKTPITWTNEAKNAFEKCKHDLAEATVLYHPSVNATLAIVVDASDNAGGAALNNRLPLFGNPLHFIPSLFLLLNGDTMHTTESFWQPTWPLNIFVI